MNRPRKWLRITGCENIPLREGRGVMIGGREVAIFNLGDRFLAVANRCPHRGGPLCEGIVSGTTVVCPLHAWKVDLQDGTVQRPADVAACVETFPTRVVEGIVLVEVPATEPACEQQTIPLGQMVAVDQDELSV